MESTLYEIHLSLFEVNQTLLIGLTVQKHTMQIKIIFIFVFETFFALQWPQLNQSISTIHELKNGSLMHLSLII